MTKREEIVQTLKELRELVECQGSPRTYPAWGICLMIKRKLGVCPTELDPWIKKWPLFSGNATYPVPDPDPNLSPRQAFNNRYAGTLFNYDEYAQNRRELLAWLITNMSRYQKPEDIPTW